MSSFKVVRGLFLVFVPTGRSQHDHLKGLVVVGNPARRVLIPIDEINEITVGRGGTRTRTLFRAGDFKSPASAIPPLARKQ